MVRKALAMSDLKEKLENELIKNEQYELFTELEMPFSLYFGGYGIMWYKG